MRQLDLLDDEVSIRLVEKEETETKEAIYNKRGNFKTVVIDFEGGFKTAQAMDSKQNVREFMLDYLFIDEERPHPAQTALKNLVDSGERFSWTELTRTKDVRLKTANRARSILNGYFTAAGVKGNSPREEA